MHDNEVLFPEDIYSKYLTIINGVNFTPREIDVISCRLNGRVQRKEIASFLSISENTVRTHIQNISLKIGNQRFLDFIERSSQHTLLKNTYYACLRMSLVFEKCLKEIAKLKRDDSPTSLIIYWQNSILKSHLINHLADTLKLLSIPVEIQERVWDQKIEKNKNADHVLILLMEKKDHPKISQEFSDFCILDLSEESNYYLAVFKILKALFPDVKLDDIFTNFQDQCDGQQNSFENIEYKTDIKGKVIEYEKRFIAKLLEIFPIRKGHLISIFLFMGLSSGGLLFFKTERIQDSTQAQNKEDKKSEISSIRSDLPIPSEANLLKRNKLLSKIEKHLKEQDGIQKVALVGVVGMGGVGKTTIARQLGRLQQSSVVWEINAETKISLINSFKNLAYSLAETNAQKSELQYIQDIKDPEEKEKQIFSFIKKRLKEISNWLLIYDNVETFASIKDYFPYDPMVWGRGKVILTTRDSNIKKSNYIQPNHIIEMGELNKVEALTLFSKVLFNCDPDQLSHIQKKEALKFLEYIPPFPLDTVAAANYLKETKIEYAEYLDKLNENSEDFINKQEELLKDNSYYDKTRYRIITLTLKHLMKIHPEFKDLILFISLIDSQNIPRDLLKSLKNFTVVDDFIHHLKRYSLITNDDSSADSISVFSIHRSNQEIFYTYLKNDIVSAQINQILQNITHALENYVVNSIEEEDFSRIALLISHCEMFLKHQDLLSDTIRETIRGELGGCYYHQGYEKRARELIEEIIVNSNMNNKKSDLQKARLLTYLGEIYRSLEEFDKTEDSFEQSLIIYRKYFPEAYINVAQINVYMGRVEIERGNYEKAKNSFEKALKLYTQYDPKNYGRIAWTLTYIGNIYREIGDFQKSKENLEKAVIIYDKYDHEQHVRKGWALILLGNAYRSLGNYEKAIYFNTEGETIYKKKYENRMPWCSVHTGVTYRKLGDYKKAKDILETSVANYNKYYPDHYLYIAWIWAHLGNTYGDLGDYEEAKSFLEKSLAEYRKKFKGDNIKSAWILAHLGHVHDLVGKHDQAKSELEKSLEIHKKYYKESHPKIAWIEGYLGNVYKNLKDYQKAKFLFAKSLKVYESHYGKKHIETAKILNSLGQTYFLEGQIEKAEYYSYKALEFFQESKHIDIYAVLENLAEIYFQKSELENKNGNIRQAEKFKTQALNYLNQAYKVVKEQFPASSPHILRIQLKLKEANKSMTSFYATLRSCINSLSEIPSYILSCVFVFFPHHISSQKMELL